MPSDNKPLPETMLAKIYPVLWLSLLLTYFLIAREMVNGTMLTNVTADICAYLIHNGSTSCDFSATWAFVATYVDIESGEGQAGVRKKIIKSHFDRGYNLRLAITKCLLKWYDGRQNDVKAWPSLRETTSYRWIFLTCLCHVMFLYNAMLFNFENDCSAR